MNKFFIAILRLGISATFLAGLFGQIVVVPTAAADYAHVWPGFRPHETFYVTLTILGIVCVQLVLAAAWVLLGMIERDAIFNDRAFLWLDVIIGATGAATLIAVAVAGHLLFANIPEPPGQDMALLGTFGAVVLCVGAGAAFAMIVAILRGLLRKATDLQTEMAEVV